ncbi:MAG: hypothetical protein JSV19_04780 [Phycisphaerales bacterium]|nr:MAG: hypothetical protein JSV19_04780 [Phycisphaerales bacterium]
MGNRKLRIAHRKPRASVRAALALAWVCGPAVVAAVVLAGCSPVPEAPPFSLTEEDWSYGRHAGKRLVTDHFEIYTTLTDADLRDVLPLFLESAYRQFTSLVPPPAEPDPKLQTYVFGNRAQWDRYVRQNFPARYPVYARISAGGFAEQNKCVVYYIRRIYTLSVVAHEGFHQYLGALFPVPVPAWVNEGLACYCETFQFKKGVPVFTPTDNAFRLNSLRQSLAGDTLIPLKEMLGTDAGKVIIRSQSAMTRAYYAQAWALVCMLRHGLNGKYRAGFDALCADIGTRESHVRARAAQIAAPDPSETSFGEAVFRAYITNDLETFEREYRQYLRTVAAF